MSLRSLIYTLLSPRKGCALPKSFEQKEVHWDIQAEGITISRGIIPSIHHNHAPMTRSSWLNNEVLAVNLGDARLNSRFASIIAAFAAKPGASIPMSRARGQRAKQPTFFLTNEVTDKNIHAPYKHKTLERCRSYRHVLAFTDITDINSTTHPKVRNAGYVHTQKTNRFLRKGLGINDVLLNA
jgi:hypothetical protein